MQILASFYMPFVRSLKRIRYVSKIIIQLRFDKLKDLDTSTRKAYMFILTNSSMFDILKIHKDDKGEIPI